MPKGVVLVVDDEAPIRDILSFYLKRAGYTVLLAENGRAAMEEMGKLQPDLILSDLRMPEMAGDELCQKVKGDPRTRDIYFMLVSAIDGTASKIGGLNLGADDMISKPFHAQEVMAKVESAFRIIGMQKEIKRQNLELTRFQERMTAELALAARLQVGLLPPIPGRAGDLRYTHRYLPAEGIGGDIYAILALPDDSVALMIADVSGHGVTAALISAMVKTCFENQVRFGHRPLAWAQAMNRDLARSTLSEQFATAFLARLDPAADTLQYVAAGHVAPMIIPQGASGGPKQPTILGERGFMLGIEEDLPFQERSVPFRRGDRLIVYTDGLVEVEREDRTFLGDEGLQQICGDLPADEEAAADHIVHRAIAFNQSTPFSDDVTLVVLDRA
ncbi:PP2C family protein-serine/threonine phosphatase [Mesoterricola sediminis]|uniref:Fused response regulator/phosphatase n=1 Tax=Mesoterricola sediminis TaxID=2927980 RepID=A0AA48H2P1_9BACT|nr:fused response regulator/phosphatase [Mesoterricola sediminis]BDU78855.1 fused response regulator/phosphatase [Mesoterricola sediminis]